jgi:signal transduction histidine kinase/ActR/RegA family two-component response regulator
LGNINRILVVDDDVPFLGSLCKFLRDLGFLVLPCQSAAEANAALDRAEEQPDLAILDVHLQGGQRNFDGLRLASNVAERCPGCRVLLTTGDELDIYAQPVLGFAELPVSGILSKPFGIQDVFSAFSGALGPPLKLRDLLGLGSRPSSTAVETPVSLSYHEELVGVCESLRAMVSAEAVVLFSIHPVSEEVKIVARADPSNLFARVGRKLELSPIRDAAIKMRSVHTGHASGHREEPVHRWLLRAYRYESCAGVPVQLNTAPPLGYALFAFHRERDYFTPVERNFVDNAARTAGHVLRTMQFDADRRSERVFEIMGKVYGSMAHDLSQALSDGFLFDQLRKEIDSGNLDEAGAIAFKLEVRSRRAQGIVHTFRSMARGQHEEESDFRIDAVLKEAVRVFRPELSDENTRCQMIPYAGPPCMVHMRKSGLEQILLNLLLNAAQQIKRVRDFRNAPGEIKVAIERSKDAQGEWAEILVYDNGPGIHKRDFDHVFDVHFTTKEDGCGMGLAVLSQQSGAIPALRASIMCGQVWLSYMKEA